MRFYPEITEPSLRQSGSPEAGRINDYGPPTGWDARLPRHPLGSGHYSWMDATLDDGIVTETWSSSDEPQTLYYPETESSDSPLLDAINRLGDIYDNPAPELQPLSDFSDLFSNTYLGDHYASYQEVLNHTDIHNHIQNVNTGFHEILGPSHSDRNAVVGLPAGMMAYDGDGFGRFGVSDDNNKVIYSTETGGGTRAFQQDFPLSDVHKHGEGPNGRVHELCFKGTATNTVTVTNGVATIDLCADGTISGCWRLYIDGTGSGTLHSGNWSDVVITHWGQATGGGSDLSIVDIVNEDGAFEPNEHPVEFYDHGADQWFQLSWEDASYSTGRIYVDSADGYKLKWECTDYTDDTIVIYRATARPITDIGTPF